MADASSVTETETETGKNNETEKNIVCWTKVGIDMKVMNEIL